MVKLDIVKCEYCPKTADLTEKTYATPIGWFRISKLDIVYRKKETRKGTGGKEGKYYTSKEFEDKTDPHFCCRACLMKWMYKQLNELTGGKE